MSSDHSFVGVDLKLNPGACMACAFGDEDHDHAESCLAARLLRDEMYSLDAAVLLLRSKRSRRDRLAKGAH